MDTTIEELEIIIKAKIDDALKGIKDITNAVKQKVRESTSTMIKLNEASSKVGKAMQPAVQEVKKQMPQVVKEVSKTVQDIKKQVNEKISFNIDDLNTDALKEKMSELISIRDNLFDKTTNTLIDESVSEELDQIIFKILEVEEALKSVNSTSINGINVDVNGNQVPTTTELPTPIVPKSISQNVSQSVDVSADFDFLPLKEQAKVVMTQIEQLIPIITKVKETIKETVNDSTSLVYKMTNATKNVGVAFSYLSGEISSKMSGIKNAILTPFQNLSSIVKTKMQPIINIASNVGKMTAGAFNMGIGEVKDKLNELGNTKVGGVLKKSFEIASGCAKILIDKIRGVGSEANKSKKSGNGLGESVSKSLSKGISSIKKFALSLLSIRTAFSVVSRAAQAYLSFDQSLSDSIQNSWNMLGSLLAPVLEYVASLFSKLTNMVAQFVKSLTGIDLVARANAKALDKQTKSAKKAGSASKSMGMSSIDDIDTLSSNSSSGGDDIQQIKVEEIDTTPFDILFNKVAEIFSQIFEPFRLAWEEVGTDVINSMTTMIGNVAELGSTVGQSILEIWTNGTGQEIITNMLIQWQLLFDIISGLATAFTNAWNNAGAGKSILQSIADIFSTIQQFGNSILESIAQWVVSDGFQEALNRVFTFIDDIFGIVKDVAEWMLSMYNTYLKPVIEDKLLPAIDEIIVAISDVWNAVKPVVNWVVDYIKTILEPVIKGLCDFIGGIIDVVRGIAKFISGVFTGDWRKAWNGIKQIFKGVMDSLAAIVKTPINMVIAAWEFLINKLIGAINFFKKVINKFSFDVPDWVPGIGGKKFGFNLKMSEEISIPRLATGNVATEPTLAIFGEYSNAKNNPEVTAPQSILKDTFRSALNEYGFSNSNEGQHITVNVAGENFVDMVVDEINKRMNRRGVSVFSQ